MKKEKRHELSRQKCTLQDRNLHQEFRGWWQIRRSSLTTLAEPHSPTERFRGLSEVFWDDTKAMYNEWKMIARQISKWRYSVLRAGYPREKLSGSIRAPVATWAMDNGLGGRSDLWKTLMTVVTDWMVSLFCSSASMSSHFVIKWYPWILQQKWQISRQINIGN